MVEFKQKTFFGRKRGKGMTGAKESLLVERMDEFAIGLPFDLDEMFGFKPLKISLEIGYGDGEHLAELAKKNPKEAFIGVEVFENGNAAMLKKVIEGGLGNVRIFPHDVHLLLPHIPDESVDRLLILYPDPWPKSRHEGRRLIGPKNLPEFLRILKSGGEMLVVSDHPVYITWVLMVIRGQDAFEWTALKSGNFSRPPKDWETTRYEQKAVYEGRVPIYLSFVKK